MMLTFLKQSLSALITPVVIIGSIPFLEGNSLSVVAQTTEERIANHVCETATKGVVTVKTGKGHGSGFIVNKEGMIITNAHVVSDAPSVVTVVFSDGKQAPADVIGFAKGGVDLAILRVYNQSNLQPLPLAPASTEKVGYRVFAIGSPVNPENQNICTSGNITKIDNKTGVITHQATISGGNSGGPLVNSQGQVLGVNTWGELLESRVYDQEGRVVGFALAQGGTNINEAQAVNFVHQLLTDHKNGNLSTQSTLARTSKTPQIIDIALNGQTINGVLEESSYVGLYRFEGKKGQPVTIEMKSQQINSVLELYKMTETGAVMIAENDDQGAGNFDAKISGFLPEDGIYLVRTRSYDKGETGNYTLRAISR
ncbi:MAG: S1C family serine protease [Microcystaceae cyanobacterium]